MRTYISEHIFGQDEANGEICDILERALEGFRYPNEPMASILSLGPTGVGKTESCILACESMFGENSLARFDMSEYMTLDRVNELLGVNGLVGVFETLYQQTHKRGFLLFDEIEKAHVLVLNLLLQILQGGRITVGSGRLLNLTDYVVVATSNLGGRVLMDSRTDKRSDIVARARREALKVILPEIYNRFQLKAVYNKIDYETSDRIARLHIGTVLDIAYKIGHKIEITEKAIQYIRSEGFDSELGVRPMRQKAMEVIGNAVLQKKHETNMKCVTGTLDYDAQTGKYAIKQQRTSERGLEIARNGISQ